MEGLEINGIRMDALERLCTDPYFKFALEYYGVPGALEALVKVPSLCGELGQGDLSAQRLEDWGLNPDVATKVLASESLEHDGVAAVISAILALRNCPEHGWPQPVDGWPVRRPVDQVFLDSPLGIYLESSGVSHNIPKEVPHVFTENGSVEYLKDRLADIGGDEVLLMHACSWTSVRRIHRKINLDASIKVTDLGRGMYFSKEPEDSLWWALRSENINIGGYPAIMIFALPKNYREMFQVVEVEGDDWVSTVAHYRKDYEAPPFLKDAEIIDGKVYASVRSVTSCKFMPSPAKNNQICVKSEEAADTLNLKLVIMYRQGTNLVR